MRKLILALIVVAIAPSGLLSQPVPAELGVGSRTGLVVSSSDIASDLGAGVLAAGGNAVDAAVATAFAMAVTHPFAGNIGGGGFMVVRTARGETASFDYRETAPGKSTQTMYLGADGKILRNLTATGYLAPGVPGTVRGLEYAARKYGTRKWAELVHPAVELAAKGFPLSYGLANSLRSTRGLAQFQLRRDRMHRYIRDFYSASQRNRTRFQQRRRCHAR
jgi:gamma-glutamyltranspeptidase/glutathione hydrolase